MLGWLLNLGFAGSGEDAPAPPPAPTPTTGGGGGRFVHFAEPYRKFTRKDEKELKQLLLEVVEKESLEAKVDLQKKARELAEVSNAAAGIRRAVEQVESIVKADARANRIHWIEARRRLDELEEEEDLILLIAGEF